MTARRRLTVVGSVKLEVVKSPDSFVRFRYFGASPHTVRSVTLAAAGRSEVPPVLPGGELCLLFAPAVVDAAFIEIVGPRTFAVVPYQDYAAFRGLTKGQYQITLVYATGLRGATQTYGVSVAETTIARVPVDRVGAIKISAPPEICQDAVEFGIAKTSDAADIRSPIFVTPSPACDMQLLGVPTGTLRMFYRLRSGSLRTQAIELVPQHVVNVSIEPFPVTVSGVATLNGQPITDARVGFASTTDTRITGSTVWTRTDSAGQYHIGLDEDGMHSVLLQKGAALQDVKAVVFVHGANKLSWQLRGGTLRVVLNGWDSKAEAEVVLIGANTARSIQWVGPVSFQALPFGRYELKVEVGPRPKRTFNQTVVIDEATPEATAVVDIRCKKACGH